MQKNGDAVQTYSTLKQTNSDYPNFSDDNTNEYTRHIVSSGSVEIGGISNIVDRIEFG